ncbi:hypothetical protein C8Q79DRAFT_1014010 [Trametes meyenii]|nr:hypothetical protein C8Q79DRAFT_1014010 [Trametes meyenii]
MDLEQHWNTAGDVLNKLPVELLNAIARLCSLSELSSLILSSRRLHEILTTLLYTSIKLYDYGTARTCVRTLSTDPASLSLKRDLSSLIRSFTMNFSHWGLPPFRKTKLARRLERALGRMSGLQHVALTATYFGTSAIFAALVRAAGPTLRSLEFKAEGGDKDADVFAGLLPNLVFPELVSINFPLLGVQPPWIGPFRHILSSRAANVRCLKFDWWEALSLLIEDIDAWPCLEELTLGGKGVPFGERTLGGKIAAFSEFPPAPNLHSLTLLCIPDGDEWPQSIIVARDVFPNLEVLACPYQLLPAFLPDGEHGQRPIRTVRLNQAYYDEDGGEGDFERDVQPEWEDLCEALACIPRSAGPIVDLSFFVNWFDCGDLGDDAVLWSRTLERLAIVVYQDPGRIHAMKDWGQDFFAHTPRLHTFLLSDAPLKASDSSLSFLFADEVRKQHAWLGKWEEHTSALKKVAFSSEFMWQKTESGWGRRKMNASEEDDDDDDDDEEEDGDNSDEADDDIESEGSVAFEQE